MVNFVLTIILYCITFLFLLLLFSILNYCLLYLYLIKISLKCDCSILFELTLYQCPFCWGASEEQMKMK